MKRILCGILIAASTLVAYAKETITIVYAFSPADTMANYSRTLAEEANKIQDKYTFIVDTKPGAGNSIAANYVRNTPNTILASSGAFFVRPNFFPNESYDIDAFRELLPQCNAPMSVASVKFASFKEVPTDKPVFVGTSGMGVVSHLIATQIASKYPNVIIVPFKSTSDATLALVAGQLDLTIGFIGEQEKWNEGKIKLNIIGTTGTKSVNKHPTLVSSGLPALLGASDNPHHLLIAATVPAERAAEWRSILVKAANTKTVRDSYAVDYCGTLDQTSDRDIQPWFASQAAHWKKLSSGVKIDK